MKPLPLLAKLACFLFVISRMWSAPNLMPALEALAQKLKNAETAREVIGTAGKKIVRGGLRLPPVLPDEVTANAKQLRISQSEAKSLAESIVDPAQRKQANQLLQKITRQLAEGQADTVVFKVRTLANEVMTRFQRNVTEEQQKKFSDLLVHTACFHLRAYQQTKELPSVAEVKEHLWSALPEIFFPRPPEIHIRNCAKELQPLIVALIKDPESTTWETFLEMYCALP